MKTLRQNARYSLRLLRKNPTFTLIAALTLALGIGANTAIFSVIYAVLLAPMPYPEPNQLVMVWSRVQGGNNVVAAADYLDWKRQNTGLCKTLMPGRVAASIWLLLSIRNRSTARGQLLAFTK